MKSRPPEIPIAPAQTQVASEGAMHNYIARFWGKYRRVGKPQPALAMRIEHCYGAEGPTRKRAFSPASWRLAAPKPVSAP